MLDLKKITTAPGRLTLGETPEGFDALVLADIARARASTDNSIVLHIARDDARLAAMAETLGYFAPELEVLHFPAWDCLPYDRVSPNPEIVSSRMATLSRLADRKPADKRPPVLLTTINAALQRVPPRDMVERSAWTAHVGNVIDLEKLTAHLIANGYSRTGTVREQGEFAVRGGIVDIFPSGLESPLRLDMFGDTLDAIRSFDAESQRTTGTLSSAELVPASEIHLDADVIRRFRASYIMKFGAATDNDPLYEAVSDGRKHQGMEHW
ncbi:MAG: transcription-repair coupling factor, partial [Parvibaculum sp.]